MPPRTATEVVVRGDVQGVGFRPFVHRLALRAQLAGWVRNESGIVRLHLEGEASAIDGVLTALSAEAPPLARIATIAVAPATLLGLSHFEVRESQLDPHDWSPVPADVATCDDCLREIHDPTDRHYRYPFTTCTNCGPRYSVIEGMPYDRARTALRHFPLCPSCSADYHAPANRRFHAESIACPACGPQLSVRVRRQAGDATRWDEAPGDPIATVAARLHAGEIVAMRGLGGFHLACDATNAEAVATLRARKRREEKPFAVMVATETDACALVHLSRCETTLLTARSRPIVLARRRSPSPLAEGVAPGLTQVGVLLAYTPLHTLLLEAVGRPLVMTSGNASDAPMVATIAEAEAQLGEIADVMLLHNREIVARVDDSVVRAAGETPIVMRRARSLAPHGVALPVAVAHPMVALGAHLKHTAALAVGGAAYLTPHHGDLETLETLQHARRSLAHLSELLRVTPTTVVHDLHPGYLSHQLGALWPDAPRVGVQHHHAHIAAVAGEHGVTTPVLGLAFDGTGAGDDGTVWGAEFLVATLATYRRVGHWRSAPLPGGDRAAREGWRALLGFDSLCSFSSPWGHIEGLEDAHQEIVRRQIAAGINSPFASSMGRLFDAAATVCGVRHASRYEGQAAMELESLAADHPSRPIPLPCTRAGDQWVIDPIPLLDTLAARRLAGRGTSDLAADFHDAVIAASASLAIQLCGAEGLDTVALGGGSFQNARLLMGIARQCRAAGLRVLVAREIPVNDGGIAYGQCVVASARFQST